MGRFASNEYKFRMPDDVQLSGMRLGKYDRVPALNDELKKRAREYFKSDFILKGAYTIELHTIVIPEIQRQTMDVDFEAEAEKNEFLQKVDKFCGTIQDLGDLKWKRTIYIDAMPEFEGVTFYLGNDEIIKIDFVKGKTDSKYIEDSEVIILRTLADKVAVVLEGSKIFRRTKDVIDIARIISDPNIDIRYEKFYNILQEVLKEAKYEIHEEVYNNNERDIVRALKSTRRAVLKDPQEVYNLVSKFITPMTMVSFGSDMKWFSDLGRWDEWHW